MTLDKPTIVILGDAAHPDVNRWCFGLASEGANIHLLSINSHNATYEPRHILRYPFIPYKLHYIVSSLKARRLLKSIKPDLVVSFDLTGYGALGMLTGFHPLVTLAVGSDILIQANEPFMKRIVRRVIRNSDMLAVLAPHMAEAAYQHHASPDTTQIIPLGIDLSVFSPREHQISDCMRIVSTRALMSFYNIPEVIRAVHILKNRGINCHLTIAGRGSQREELELLCSTLNIQNNIEFVGFIPNTEIPKLLREHQYYVSLSPSDGVSSSLIEAMAVGLFPIVPDNLANVHWVTNGENGMLVNALTAEALANCLEQVHRDITLQKRAYHQNLEIVRERADISQNSQQYLKVFREIISSYNR